MSDEHEGTVNPDSTEHVPDVDNVDSATRAVLQDIEQPQEEPLPEEQPEVQEAPPEMQMVVLSAKDEGKALPVGKANIGRTGIEIPDTQGQLAGFEVTKKQAAVLVAQFPQYKFLVDKGTNTPNVNI